MPMKLHCYVSAVLLIALFAGQRHLILELNVDALKAYALSLLNQLLHPTLEQALIWPVYLGWLWLLTILVPGYWHRGAPLADGSIVDWKINGLWCFLLTVAGYAAAVHYGLFRGSLVAANVGLLVVQGNLISLVLSLAMLVKGRLAGATSGDVTYDLIAGPELNPYVLGVPLKLFFLKPAMIGWTMVNMSFAYAQYEAHGALSVPMLTYQALSNFYVFDYFWVEEKMTSTWDIVAEHYGLMLNWAHLVFMPFVFSIQAHFLVNNLTHSPVWLTLLNSSMFGLGYVIFRMCNSQKHDFKHNPNQPIWGKKPEAIGGKLLLSGFWGMARHVNYLGDLIIAVSLALPCGFSSVWPWTYPLYLTLLLVHRENRDDRRCAEKYKDLWAEYTARVPYHIIPGVY